MQPDVFGGPGFLVGLFLGVLLGWVTLWSFLNPQVGRVVARIVAVVAIGFGVVWVVTAIGDSLNGTSNQRYESPLGQGGFGAALGWGSGGLALGIAVLVLSFLRPPGKAGAPGGPGKEVAPDAGGSAAPQAGRESPRD
jgi:hypothetical protein